jgi:hypothetical protein
MLRFFLIALLPALAAAAPLALVGPQLSQMEDGPAEPAGFARLAGDTFYLRCRVTGFAKDAENKVRLHYSVQPYDSAGVPLAASESGKIAAEVLSQDRDWAPRVHAAISLPPLLRPGEHSILVQVEDEIAHATASLSVPFTVRGDDVAPSPELVVRGFAFYAAEENLRALSPPVFRPGDTVWAKFDVVGFRYGPQNRVSVSYAVALTAVASGRVLWSNSETAGDPVGAFYPMPWIPARLGLNLQSTIDRGEYSLSLTVTDLAGQQVCSSSQRFEVQ